MNHELHTALRSIARHPWRSLGEAVAIVLVFGCGIAVLVLS